jgi:tetratricopeptide (TPR) repeat protein
MAFSHMFIGNAYRPRAEFDRALSALQGAMDNADRSGFLAGKLFARAELGMVYALLGQYSRGVELLRAIVDAPEYADFQHMWFRAMLSYVYVVTGDLSTAEETLRPALAEQTLDTFVEVIVALVLPSLLLARGSYAEAAQAAAGGVERMHVLGARLLVPETLLVLGQARLALNETELARAALQEAESEAEAMGFRWTLWQIRAARAALECAAGNTAEAQRLQAQARAGIMQIAAELGDPELKASLLNRPVVRSVLEQEPLPH